MSKKFFAVVAAQDPSIRMRAGIELSVLVTLTLIFFAFQGAEDIALQLSLALPFVAFVVAGAGHTRIRIWGLDDSLEAIRRRRAITSLAGFTLAAAGACLAWGVWHHNPIANPTMVYAIALYLPWALAQEFIFQFYLLGRLRAVMPNTSPVLVAMLNGVAYGLVHMPDAGLALGASMAGSVWSYFYLRDRKLLPIAVSHAVLGASFYYWVVGCDLFDTIISRFSNF